MTDKQTPEVEIVTPSGDTTYVEKSEIDAAKGRSVGEDTDRTQEPVPAQPTEPQ